MASPVSPEALEQIVSGAIVRAGFSTGSSKGPSPVSSTGLSDAGATLVAGVSGGPDSTALLHCLMRLREQHGFHLHVAHLNHDFRGQEADDDASHVARLAEILDLPATVEKWDPVEFRRNHPERASSSFEDLAREMRYAFLAGVARSTSAAAVAVGHTADDQAETVLLHILRGSGLHGLTGMSELADWPWPGEGQGISLFRPLLNAGKEDTFAYCRDLGLETREDSGNSLSRFARVRVRRQLMPELASEYNPRIREALVRLARTASQELDYLEGEAGRIWETIAREVGGDVHLSLPGLPEVHPALQALLLRRAYANLKGDSRRLHETHLKLLIALAAENRSGRAAALPGGITVHQTHASLVFSRQTSLPCPLPSLDGDHILAMPSHSGEEAVTEVQGWRVGISYSQPEIRTAGIERSGQWEGQPWGISLSADAIVDGLTIRTRRPGDRFQPLGMAQGKKLHDFFIDQKVPRSWRDRVPLLIAQRRIAAVFGHRVSEWARVDNLPLEEAIQVTINRLF